MSNEESSKVIPLRITATALQSRIREAAQQSSNVVFVPKVDTGSLGGMLTYKQALFCLREGKVIGKPTMNEHNDWAFTMQRFAAGHLTTVCAVATCVGARVVQLTVLIDEN